MNKLFGFFLFYIILFGVTVYGGDVSKLVLLFEGAPAWPGSSKDANKELIYIYEDIARNYDVVDARKAVEAVVEKSVISRDPTQRNKLFIFNRIYFKINSGQAILHGGYSRGWTLDCDGVPDLLAPLGIDEHLKFYFKCGVIASMGPPYEPLKEFDFFNTKFGRRYLPSKKEGD